MTVSLGDVRRLPRLKLARLVSVVAVPASDALLPGASRPKYPVLEPKTLGSPNVWFSPLP